MKYFKQFFVLFFLFYSFPSISQNGVVNAGFEAVGSGGKLSASVGQVAYHNYSGSNGSLSEGLQQAYEIFITSTYLHLNDPTVHVYPNPTTDRVTIKIEDHDDHDLQYRLMDAQGRVITTKYFEDSQAEINFQQESTGIYYVQLIHQAQILKTIKILKN